MMRPAAVCTALLAVTVIAGCKGKGDSFDFASLPPTPAVHAEGERLFNASCATCHGAKGSGTAQGPPLVHIIYEPGHHSDMSFQMAVERGVVAHHWRFGNMPPVPGVTRDQTAQITSYIRWIQREAGIQ